MCPPPSRSLCFTWPWSTLPIDAWQTTSSLRSRRTLSELQSLEQRVPLLGLGRRQLLGEAEDREELLVEVRVLEEDRGGLPDAVHVLLPGLGSFEGWEDLQGCVLPAELPIHLGGVLTGAPEEVVRVCVLREDSGGVEFWAGHGRL